MRACETESDRARLRPSYICLNAKWNMVIVCFFCLSVDPLVCCSVSFDSPSVSPLSSFLHPPSSSFAALPTDSSPSFSLHTSAIVLPLLSSAQIPFFSNSHYKLQFFTSFRFCMRMETRLWRYSFWKCTPYFCHLIIEGEWSSEVWTMSFLASWLRL